MRFVTSIFLAAALAGTSRADVTIQIFGTVSSGTDGNPASRPPGAGNVFGGGSNLAGKPAVLTLHISDSEGTNTRGKCSDGSIYTSTIEGSNRSDAPTATLQIGNGSFTYGAYPLYNISWSTGRTAHGPCSSYNEIGFGWTESYDGSYMGSSGFGSALLYTMTNLSSGDWHFTVPRVSISGAVPFQFSIAVTDRATLKNSKYAHGYLTPEFVSVNGITPLDYKATAAAVGSLGKTANAFDVSSIVTEGLKNLPLNIAISVTEKVILESLFANDQLFGEKVELSKGTIDFFIKLFQEGLTKNNVPFLALNADHLIFSAAALVANLQADDPPDQNFTTVEPPQPLSFATTGNPQVDKVLADYLTFISLMAATLHAGERWQGAVLAGDEVSAALQESAYQTYSQQAANAAVVLTADNAILSSASPVADISNFPGGATAIANAYKAQCGRPLPSDLNADLPGMAFANGD